MLTPFADEKGKKKMFLIAIALCIVGLLGNISTKIVKNCQHCMEGIYISSLITCSREEVLRFVESAGFVRTPSKKAM